MTSQAGAMRKAIDAVWRIKSARLLLDQDRSHWDQLLIHRGLAALECAETLGRPLGPYTLQAALESP